MATATYDLLASSVLTSSASSVTRATFERDESSTDFCILFPNYYDKKTGYGVRRYKGKLYKAHRFAYIKAHGEIDRKTHIDHQCHNRAIANGTCTGGACFHRRCVNVKHLRAVSASENFTAGMNGLDNRTHCKNGHDTREVGIWEATGRRQCFQCRQTSVAKANKVYKAKMENK